jgi:hypothetical protein
MKFRKSFNTVKKNCHRRHLFLVFLIETTASAVFSQKPYRTTDSETIYRQKQRVRDFVAAFNARNTERMLPGSFSGSQVVLF